MRHRNEVLRALLPADSVVDAIGYLAELLRERVGGKTS
jgi:hypothetical protein